ncbi:unnamed protein product, partial [Allacma fusca]
MKKAPSITFKISNGTGKMEKKFEFIEFLKKIFVKATPNGNRVGNQLWPILSILKTGGYLPLFISDKKDHFISHAVLSWQSLPTLAIGTFLIYWWSAIIYHFGVESSAEILKPSQETPLTRINSVLQPIIQVAEIVTGWLTCKQMAEFINNWQTFETQFNTVFKDVYKYKLNVRRFRDFLLIFYVILPALYFIQHQEYILSPELINGNKVFSTLLTFSVVIFSFLVDVKTLLMYRVVQENFRETKNGIVAQYKMTHAITKTPLGPEKVKQWIQLVNMIRNQHKLSCQIQTPHQLTSIALSVIILTNNLHLFVNSLVNCSVNKAAVSYLPMGAFAVVFFRLVFKCIMAEKVSDEEQSIAQELIQMESSGANIFIKMELKFMYDLIVSKPTVTSFANLITLSKAFLLQV